MTAKNFSTVTTELIASYGNTAKNVIHAYRAGGERMVDFLEQRWESALEESSPQLTAEVRANALNAQKVFGSYYAKGLAYTTDGAGNVVNQLLKLADAGVQQVAANAARFEEKTGMTALNQVAHAALPAVAAVSKLALHIEKKSAELAAKMASDELAPRTTPFKKARARKAA